MSSVTQPNYYSSEGKDLIEHFKEMFTPEMFRGFMIGNNIKYVSRYTGKNGIEDLEKAREYINRLIGFERELAIKNNYHDPLDHIDWSTVRGDLDK